METNHSSLSSQEKVAAALASFLFFIPLFMDMKTPFVVKYMKQGFFINLVQVVVMIVSSFVYWWWYRFFSFVNLACFLTSLFLALQAFSGKEFVIAFVHDTAESVIKALGISNLFTPNK